MKGNNVIVRSSQSGVWFGRLVSTVGTPDGLERVVLANARRIWCWEGAGSCSGLAAHGPRIGKIAPPVAATISGVCERLEATAAAVKAIAAIAEWRP
jgi:hypothetical protein